MPRGFSAKVAFAVIAPPPDLGPVEPRRALLQAIVTGSHIERYGREWRMGPHSADRQQRFVTGRIGFQRPGGVSELWDEERRDFVEQAVKLGITTPFSIRLADLRVAFQRRPGVIERQSFAGALEALLHESSSYKGWKVVPETDPVRLKQFLDDVDRVTKVTVRLDRPNPQYGPRQRVEELIEGSVARYLQLVAVAQEGASLNMQEPLLSEAIAHVAENYGYAKVDAEQAGRKVEYDSRRHGIAPEVEIALPSDEREASGDQVRGTLGAEEES